MKKVLIIGAGKSAFFDDIGYRNIFTTYSKTFYRNSFFKVILVVDISKDNLKSVKKKYKYNISTNLSKTLKNKNYDLIIISTPTKTHFKIFEEIFKFKKKITILCEKPCGNSYREIVKIQTLCRKNQSKCFVNYPRISLESSKRIFSLIKNTKYQAKGVVFYSSSVKNSASHYINLFQHFFGNIISVKKFYEQNKSKKKYKDFLLIFKKASINFLYIKNKINFGEFILNLQNKKIIYSNAGTIIKRIDFKDIGYFKNKMLIENNEYKIMSDNLIYQKKVIKELQKYFTKKSFKLCDLDLAVKTMKVINQLDD